MNQETNLLKSDYFLQTLSGFANDLETEIGITLYVKGAIVTGSLISRDQYFIGIENMFKEAAGDGAKIFADALEGARIGNEQKVREEKEIEESDITYNYIHLKNAKFFDGGELHPTNSNIYWRGLINSIDGFSLGTLSKN